MARIIYSISGEGMGHATRSKPLIEYLIKRKHKVKIFSSGRAYCYLGKNFDDTHEIQGIYMKYHNNAVDEIGTLLLSILNFSKIIVSFSNLMKTVSSFRPDIIISDLEAISNYVAFLKNIPLISIDNQHIYPKTKISFPKKYWLNHIETRIVYGLIMPSADYYFITTFFYPKIISKNVFLIPPILRKEIKNIKPKEQDYMLVYQTSDTNIQLIESLKKINKKFIVYGFNQDKKEGNIIFRKNNETIFLKELANCKAVITNGGFTLISEALYLGKPVLSIPVRRQFEQILNALYLNKLGYGKHVDYATKENINSFIKNIPKYKKNLKKYKRGDDTETFKKIEKCIEELSS